MELKSYGRWYDYSRARDEMFAATDTPWAPWYVARSDNKRRARLNIIAHLLGKLDHEPLPREKVEPPKRQERGDYREPDYPYKFIREKSARPDLCKYVRRTAITALWQECLRRRASCP